MVCIVFKEGIKKARRTHIEERALGTDTNLRPPNEEAKERVPNRDTLCCCMDRADNKLRSFIALREHAVILPLRRQSITGALLIVGLEEGLL